MPLINLSKEELKKVEYYLLGDTDPLIVSVLEKIRSLDEVCECNNTSTKWYAPLKFPYNEGIHSHKFFEFL